MATFNELTDFFQQVGASDVTHTTKTYLAHAISVHGDLKKWGCDEEMQNVGLFHTILRHRTVSAFHTAARKT